MCLAVPGRIIEIDQSSNIAKIDVMGVERSVSLDLVPQARTGDHVLVHAGFAISVVDESEANETLELLEELARVAGPDARIAG